MTDCLCAIGNFTYPVDYFVKEYNLNRINIVFKREELQAYLSFMGVSLILQIVKFKNQ